jgi:hypothetical protein
MKALFTLGADVPFGRIVSDHRRWLLPLVAVLVINIAVLVAAVLPLRRAVESGSIRAQQSDEALREAQGEFAYAEATRDGQAQASADLDLFYREVLPSGLSMAQRILGLKLAQMARAQNVTFMQRATSPETLANSALERLRVSYTLSGDWDDVRQLIYEIETAPEFAVIDNVGLSESSETLSLTLDVSTYYRARRDAR